jgi:hypothetical protein
MSAFLQVANWLFLVIYVVTIFALNPVARSGAWGLLAAALPFALALVANMRNTRRAAQWVAFWINVVSSSFLLFFIVLVVISFAMDQRSSVLERQSPWSETLLIVGFVGGAFVVTFANWVNLWRALRISSKNKQDNLVTNLNK